MIPFFELNPRLQWLIEDDRIYALGEDLLGPDFVLNATEGNLHVGDTQWHGGGLDPNRYRTSRSRSILNQTPKKRERCASFRGLIS